MPTPLTMFTYLRNIRATKFLSSVCGNVYGLFQFSEMKLNKGYKRGLKMIEGAVCEIKNHYFSPIRIYVQRQVESLSSPLYP